MIDLETAGRALVDEPVATPTALGEIQRRVSRRRRRRYASYGASVAGVAAFGGVIALATRDDDDRHDRGGIVVDEPASGKVVVPDVRGLDPGAALEALEAADLTLAQYVWGPHETRDVYFTDPAPGDVVPAGTAVIVGIGQPGMLTPSSSLAVPQLVGLRMEEAAAMLGDLGFAIEAVDTGDWVVAQTPSAGENVAEGSAVRLWLGSADEAAGRDAPTTTVLGPMP